MSECYKGWSKEDGNTKGRCCCNCQHQVEIHRHPWNSLSGGRMKGPISLIAGWGCQAPDFDGKIIFFEDEHACCEVHEWKTVD